MFYITCKLDSKPVILRADKELPISVGAFGGTNVK